MFVIASPIDVVLWARSQSLGLMIKIVLVAASLFAVSSLFLFLGWASDPNYPERLLRGRVLFVAASVTIYLLNLAALWRHRAA